MRVKGRESLGTIIQTYPFNCQKKNQVYLPREVVFSTNNIVLERL